MERKLDARKISLHHQLQRQADEVQDHCGPPRSSTGLLIPPSDHPSIAPLRFARFHLGAQLELLHIRQRSPQYALPSRAKQGQRLELLARLDSRLERMREQFRRL